MKRLFAIFTTLLVCFFCAANLAAQDKSDEAKSSFTWHIIINQRDDVGIDTNVYHETLSKAFRSLGDTVEEQATADNITLYILIGKDDADDDNDGTPDGQDTDDYGDGFADKGETIKTLDMDKDPKFTGVMSGLPDEDKDEGVYISITSEDGVANIFTSKADSFQLKAEELKDAAKPGIERFFGHAMLRPAFFAIPNQESRKRFQLDPSIAVVVANMEKETEAKKQADAAVAAAIAARPKEDAEDNKSKDWVTILKPGEKIEVGNKLDYPAGHFVFNYGGSIELYDKDFNLKWSSYSFAAWFANADLASKGQNYAQIKTGNGNATELRMQEDGNLTAFLGMIGLGMKANQDVGILLPYWSSNTQGNNQAVLQVLWSKFKLRLLGKDGKVLKNFL